MSFDFSRVNLSNQQSRPIDPIAIFQASSITDENINDLWLAQGDALREWNKHRVKSDVAVALNTGAGKTLVGLLIAQSLVNETNRQVVYACSSIQLVEQTAEKAKGYGLPVTTYYGRSFSTQEYFRAEAPCVTTYHALFNGKSRFRTDDIAAVIFDDAHTAEHILRDQFSLMITRAELHEVYMQIVSLYRQYHTSVGMATRYGELFGTRSSHLFFVPPSELRRNIGELRRILLQANLNEHRSTMFSWEHIKDHEDLCCLLISFHGITLTPPVVPVATLPYFNEGVRRVYLSATLRAPDSFVRSFGRQPEKRVAPSTTAGECERMILVPSIVEAVDNDVESAKAIVRDQKTLILVPSFSKAEAWQDIAPTPSREFVPDEVASFKEASTPIKLTLAARYDGIDLPGDTCRMMVVDELPTRSGPLETFQWERLGMQNSLRSMLATRIVQSFGRISRGMSDHGVVLLTGKSLVDWLLVPRNRSLLPGFLQRQIKIGEGVSKEAASTEDLQKAACACLLRDSGWIQAYTTNMRDLPSEDESQDQESALQIATAEARFGKALWNRDFERAAEILNAVLQDAFDFSQNTGAWLSLWLGFALEMNGDYKSASYFYRKSRATQPALPFPTPPNPEAMESIPQQASNVADQMQVGHSNSISIDIPRTILQDISYLDGSGSARQVEEALRCLGQYLGLQSARPDNEFCVGPDVLWLGEDGFAICMEVKTCKEESSLYRKREVGQLHSHVQWVRDNYEDSDILPVFVGPLVPPSEDASPSPEMKVIELRQFEDLGKRLVSALEDASSDALPSTISRHVNEVFRDRQLQYPKAVLTLDMAVLQDILPK